jgi:hypothetical protein
MKFSILGDSSSALGSLKQFSDGVKGTTQQVSGSMEGLSKAFAGFAAPLAAISGLLAGGAMFKDAINSAKEMGTEVRRLSTYFQISNTDAGHMAEALKRMGSNADEYIGMADKIAKQVGKNEERYNQLGVATRDISGAYLTQIEIMDNVKKKLDETEGSTARNILANDLAKKGGKEMVDYLTRYQAAVKATEENLKRLGVAINYDELVAGTKRYKSAMADVDQQVDVMKVSVAMDLMPALTEMGSWLADILPPILKTVSVLIKGIMIGIYTLVFVVKSLGAVWGAIFGALLDSAIHVSDAFNKLIHFDFAGAKESAKKAGAAIVVNLKAAVDQVSDDFDKLGEKVARVIDGAGDAKETVSKKTGGKPGPEKDTDKVVDAYKKELEAKRVAQAESLQLDVDFYNLSMDYQYKFWQEKLTHYKQGTKDYNAIAKEVASARKAMTTEEVKKEQEDLKLNLEKNKYDYDQRIVLANEFLSKQKSRFGENSEQYKEANLQVQTLLNERKEIIKKLQDEIIAGQRNHDLAMLEMDKATVQDQYSRLEITATERINLLRQIADEEFRIREEALMEQIDLGNMSVVEEEKLWNKLSALRDKHKAETIASKRQMDDELRKADGGAGFTQGIQQWLIDSADAFKTWSSFATQMIGTVVDSFGKGMADMILHGATMGQALKGIWTSLSTAVVQSLTKMAAQEVVHWGIQKMVALWKQVNTKTELATDTAATSQKLALNTTKQASDATTAGQGFFSAFASIPFGLGIPLAIAAIALMMGVVSKITAHAKGGVIDKPTLAMMGEVPGSTEIVANENDFKSWANSLQNGAYNLGANIGHEQASIRGYDGLSNEYARQAVSAGSEPRKAMDFSGANIFTSDSREMQDFLYKANYNWQKSNG